MFFKCYFCVLIVCQLASAVDFTSQVLPLTDPVKFIEALLGGYKQDNDSSSVAINESAYQESNGLRQHEGYVYVELSTRKHPGGGIQIGTLQLYYKPPLRVSTRSIKDLGYVVGRNDELFRTCLHYEEEVDFSYMRAHSGTKNALQIFSQQMNQILGIYGGGGHIEVFYDRGNENTGYRKGRNIIGVLDLGYLNFQYFTKNSGRADDKALLALGRNVLHYYFQQLREGQRHGEGFKIEFRQAKHDQRHKDIGDLHFSFVKSQNLRGDKGKSKPQKLYAAEYNSDPNDDDDDMDIFSYEDFYRTGSSGNRRADEYDDSDDEDYYIFWNNADYRMGSSGNGSDDEDEVDHSGSGHLRLEEENQLKSFASAMDKVVMKHNYRTKFRTSFVRSSHDQNSGNRIDLGTLNVKYYTPSIKLMQKKVTKKRKPKTTIIKLSGSTNHVDDDWWRTIKPKPLPTPHQWKPKRTTVKPESSTKHNLDDWWRTIKPKPLPTPHHWKPKRTTVKPESSTKHNLDDWWRTLKPQPLPTPRWKPKTTTYSKTVGLDQELFRRLVENFQAPASAHSK